jgi:methyltransferase (TIGR00027 family)
MTGKAAKTGPGAMVLVAIEQEFSEQERIITDPLAYPILPFGSRVWVRLTGPFREWIVRKTEEKVPGLWGGIMARKRCIDDAVAEAVADSLEAVVNLGAGFDTRAYRLPELAAVGVWEVDQPWNTCAKRRRLQTIFGEVPAHVTLVPMDFDCEDLSSVLASHGYPADKKTFFILEGVTQYLTEPGIRTTFDFLGATPAGSRLVFTYTPKDFITGRVFYFKTNASPIA